VLSALYAAIARRRREFYAGRPDRRKRLRHPVISVGNLAVGGRGKTPVVAAIARLLLDMGERPAILSRGYGRRRADAGVVIVRDSRDVRADLDRAGDEPLMLARQLPGVSILSASDRYLAGCLAERHLGATVHLLDDGFQHLQLDRDIDLVIVAGEDLDNRAQTLPFGRLRELPDALVAATAVLALDDQAVARGLDSTRIAFETFRLKKVVGEAIGDGASTGKVLAVAGIAHPQRFFDDLRATGYEIVQELAYRDHHPYSRHDLDRMFASARAVGATRILTTEKDYVRMLPFRPFALPVAWIPLTLEPDPLPEFRAWLERQLDEARDVVRPSVV
jgi:tetraacyldisaccharide 4'-kinase